ncbi:MAG: hypothetical protein ABWZ02_06415 [Nakamurella sp.]
MNLNRGNRTRDKRSTGRLAVVAALTGLTLIASLFLVNSAGSGQTEIADAAPDQASPRVSTAVAPPTAPTVPGGPLTTKTPAKPAPKFTIAQQISTGVTFAAAQDVEQAVAVMDRTTGQLVAGIAGDKAFNSESITKLFTVAYYLVRAGGAPDAGLSEDLRSLIQESNNTVQMDLWQPAVIPTIADRYRLTGTSNSPAESPSTWGSDQITANDLATFLYAASRDPLVGPLLMGWMRGTPATGADGFDQSFGFNALSGQGGSKQGWSDPGWSPANLHSVGWTGRYFAAVLQTSASARYATMRSTSTTTAALIAATSAGSGAH